MKALNFENKKNAPAYHIVIVAGEASGDQHAAALIKSLKTLHPHLSCAGIGGKHLEAAGVPLLYDLAQYGVTGIIEVFKYARIIYQAYQTIKSYLKTHRPDLLILVDYPGFNLRLAKLANSLNIKVVYYISPQLWAWKKNRIHTIKACVSHMGVIFPFEKDMYHAASVKASFVGHPLVKTIDKVPSQIICRQMLKLPQDSTSLIALLPGSRTQELQRHFPIMVETAALLHQKFPTLHFIIPIASTLSLEAFSPFLAQASFPYTLVEHAPLETIQSANYVIVASGTASLECALLEKPMCIVYKTSFITAAIAAKVIRVRYLGLCNILSNKMIVPELLQHDCSAQSLTTLISDYIENPQICESMIAQLKQLKHSLCAEVADCSISELVSAELQPPSYMPN